MARHAERSDTAQRVAAEWAAGGGHLLAAARRVLGGPVEAEDVVQDAFARLARQPVEEIEDLHAWLVVAVRRLALDRLRSAHHRLSEPTDRVESAPAAEGARDVAAGVLRFLGPSSGGEVAVVPLGLEVGILVARSSRPFSLVRLEIAGGGVRRLRGLVLSAAATT